MSWLPYEIKEDIKENIHRGLLDTVDAYQELGSPPSVAVDEAIHQWAIQETAAQHRVGFIPDIIETLYGCTFMVRL